MRPIHYIALIRKMDIGEQYTSEYTKKAYKQRSRARPTLFPSKRRALQAHWLHGALVYFVHFTLEERSDE